MKRSLQDLYIKSFSEDVTKVSDAASNNRWDIVTIGLLSIVGKVIVGLAITSFTFWVALSITASLVFLFLPNTRSILVDNIMLVTIIVSGDVVAFFTILFLHDVVFGWFKDLFDQISNHYQEYTPRKSKEEDDQYDDYLLNLKDISPLDEEDEFAPPQAKRTKK